MIPAQGWQRAVLNQLARHFEAEPAIVGVLLLGSVALGSSDRWSDLDLLLIAEDEAWPYIWPLHLPTLGELFTQQQQETETGGVAKFVYTDFRRVEVVVARASSLARTSWPLLEAQQEIETLFARSEDAEALTRFAGRRPSPPLISDSEFDDLVEEFWFRTTVALGKIIRHDLLIALHLCLENVQTCAVLAMLERDRATGTNVHKDGGIGNEVARRLEATRTPHTREGLLDCIEATAFEFDRIAGDWSRLYRPRTPVVLTWLRAAREQVLTPGGPEPRTPANS